MAKIHPGTWLIFAACPLHRWNTRTDTDFLWLQRSTLALLIVLSLATFLMVLRSGPASVAFVFDTYFVALLASLYLPRAHPAVAKGASILIIGLVLLNAAIAVMELALQRHLLPDPGFAFDHFRAYAILGHPLLNALLTGTVALFVLANRSLGRASLGFLLLCLAATLAFGARAAVAILVPLALLSELARLGRRIRTHRANLLDLATVPVGSLALVAATGLLAFQTRFGDRVLGMADLTDDSTTARLKVLSIYQGLPSADFWFGISPSAKRMLIDQNPYFSTIENFWIDMSLSFGMISFAAIVVAFLIYLTALLRTALVFATSATVFFLLVASTNNSLSVKSPALLVLAALVVASRRAASATPHPAIRR